VYILVQEDALHVVLESVLVQEISQKVLNRLERYVTTDNNMSVHATSQTKDTSAMEIQVNTNYFAPS